MIASTPSAYTGVDVPITVSAGGEACVDEILFDADARVARFGATGPPTGRAPAVEVVARGYSDGDYRSDYTSVVRVSGGWTATRQLDVRLEPPRRSVFGTFCVRNLGSRPIDLVGNENGRAYSRPTLRVNGEVSPHDLNLRFLQGANSNYWSRAGQIMDRASTLRPFGAWWWWVLTIGIAAMAPVGVGLAMRSALAIDAANGARER